MFRKFIPLPNFQEGSRNYENTCFIAAVINLSAWLPAIETSLIGARGVGGSWKCIDWQLLITAVRKRWHRKYAWTPESSGQDDAAELLGDILFDELPGNFAIVDTRHTRAAVCGHKWASQLLKS